MESNPIHEKKRIKPIRVILTDHSKAMFLLWFILIVNVHPLSVYL